VRTLLILRHSKSGHDQPVSDKQRTLTSQGRKDARRMGELARERNSIPDRVLCSTATRARETIEFFAQGAKLKQPIDFLDALYLADPAAIIREQARASELVMVVGHNPGLEGLVAKLTGEHIELPTTALAECALPIQSWSDLEGKIAGTLLAILKPKDQP
jgi:phosphohistidine phosphatase